MEPNEKLREWVRITQRQDYDNEWLGYSSQQAHFWLSAFCEYLIMNHNGFEELGPVLREEAKELGLKY